MATDAPIDLVVYGGSKIQIHSRYWSIDSQPLWVDIFRLPPFVSAYLPAYLSTCLSTRLPAHISAYLPAYLPIYLPTTYLLNYPSACVPAFLPTNLSTCLPVCLSTRLTAHLLAYVCLSMFFFLQSCLNVRAPRGLDSATPAAGPPEAGLTAGRQRPASLE